MRVNVVASCTDKKLLKVPPELQLSRVPAGDVSARAATWCQRLAGSEARKLPALDLYGGQHWSVVRSLPADGTNAGLEVRLWVASAGYGLWNCDWLAHAYSATFSGMSRDAVAPAGKSGRALRQAWWNALGQGEHRLKSEPRSVAELTEHDRNAVLMIVAPPAYVEAMEPDLVRAGQHRRSKQKLLVVSTSSPLQAGPLGAYWIECPGALVFELGGGVASLHARVARHLLLESRKTGLEVQAVREQVAALSRKAGDWPENTRSPVTDHEVLQFIRSELRDTSGQSRSSLLRKFRDSGRKCQMERFNRLFATLKEGGVRG
ncbi:hypothetical protein [Hyalangium gracile]|uniref:hypothetical protein n=1 Tax=Hyalangium gracile TaxID=394092 RepID=UPI001CC92DE9|nr:hypothetical protein [Hyalangium gracile]